MGWSSGSAGPPGFGLLTYDPYPRKLFLQGWRSTGTLLATYQMRTDNRVYLSGRISPADAGELAPETVIAYLPAWRCPDPAGPDENRVWAYPDDGLGNYLRLYVSADGRLKVYDSGGSPPYGDLDGISYYQETADKM